MSVRRSARIRKENQAETLPLTVQLLDEVNGSKWIKTDAFKEFSISKSHLNHKRRKIKKNAQVETALKSQQTKPCDPENKPRFKECECSPGDKITFTNNSHNLASLEKGQGKYSKPSELLKQNSKSGKSLIEEANAYLIQVEPKLKPIIEQNPCHLFSPEGLAQEIEPFAALVNSIISQQISGAAAKSIKKKFITLFNQDNPDAANHSYPTPSQVSAISIETIRTAGLTQRKAEYIKGIAAKFETGELNKYMLLNAPYDEVYESLIKIRGLGKWTIEMFACFCLKRPDIFSPVDIGIQKGMATLLGRDTAKLKKNGGKWKYITEKEMEEIANKFRPYRSIYMWYIWRVEETTLCALED